MLMYGDINSTRIDFAGKGVIYNLTTMSEEFIKLPRLIPPNSIGHFTDREFDIAYMNYIMNYDEVFCEFFQIIYNLYIGIDVLIIASKDDWSENILESLLKLIQQRYGYDAVYIETDEDYMYARNYCFSDFAPGFGVYNLDQDKERFSYIMENYRLINNGNLPFNLEGFVVPDEY